MCSSQASNTHQVFFLKNEREKEGRGKGGRQGLSNTGKK